MPRTQLASGSLTSLTAALTLLTTGCTEKANGAQAAADACRANGAWSAEKQAEWLRPAVSFPAKAAAEDPAVVIGSHTGAPVAYLRGLWVAPPLSRPASGAPAPRGGVIGSHTGAPVCEPIAVQVQFWEATATPAGTDLRSVLRFRLTTDGSTLRTIGFPAGLSPEERDDCTGVLMAVYPGVPLAQTELPAVTARLTPASTTTDTEFGSTRVAAQQVLPPTTTCSTPEEPTPNPWGNNHP
ncbi:hypothetical protein [Streptomyces bottropensis]|uniref:hypothetical protein n=1 Tax=Streptomyces bottropensis TaxID=42235 RepID=UPI00367BAB45